MKDRRVSYPKLRARWERHRRACRFCRAAIRGARTLHRPCDVERYLYEAAERARLHQADK